MPREVRRLFREATSLLEGSDFCGANEKLEEVKSWILYFRESGTWWELGLASKRDSRGSERREREA